MDSYQAEKVQMAQLQAQQQYQNAQLKQADIFDQFRDAKISYDDACREHARITNMRDQCAKRLADLQQGIAQVIQSALHDPTVPQPPEPIPGLNVANIGNGRWF